MPKEMLMEKAGMLREIADALESYASDDNEEEVSEGEAVPPKGPSSGEPSSGGGDKMKMALMAMRKGK